MNPGKSHQLRYVYSIGWIGWDVAVHMGEIDDLKVEVIPLVVNADMIRCSAVFVSYSSVKITHLASFDAMVVSLNSSSDG